MLDSIVNMVNECDEISDNSDSSNNQKWNEIIWVGLNLNEKRENCCSANSKTWNFDKQIAKNMTMKVN